MEKRLYAQQKNAYKYFRIMVKLYLVNIKANTIPLVLQ